MQFQLTTIFSVLALMSGSVKVPAAPTPVSAFVFINESREARLLTLFFASVNPSTTSCLRAVSVDGAAVEGVECLKV
ncbi:hypothetical protein BELL_0142g00140 [Botrytis elliptica]|uniref:Secreted protein n=1 Tax=Botrytis elliptica TaxID=278938 RepID=A0A4Z1JSD7_9HELO|nr:hypothetical protein BELL_0142g00140 [Botrytis elliptica]